MTDLKVDVTGTIEISGCTACSEIVAASFIADKAYKDEIQDVADKIEKVLRILTFTLLEAMMEEEKADGDLVLSTIPPSIINELRLTRKHFFNSDVHEGNEIDKFILKKLVLSLQRQLESTAKHYHKAFHKLTAQLNITSEFMCAYDTFVVVCRKLCAGEVSWASIASLICFGAEVALWVIREGGPGVETYLKKIIHYVVEFFVKEEIAEWISKHGGWMAMVDAFDSPGCKDHANHILSVMAISELTRIDIWLERIVTVLMVTGFCYSVMRFLT